MGVWGQGGAANEAPPSPSGCRAQPCPCRVGELAFCWFGFLVLCRVVPDCARLEMMVWYSEKRYGCLV